MSQANQYPNMNAAGDTSICEPTCLGTCAFPSATPVMLHILGNPFFGHVELFMYTFSAPDPSCAKQHVSCAFPFDYELLNIQQDPFVISY